MCVLLDRGFVTFMSFPNGEKKGFNHSERAVWETGEAIQRKWIQTKVPSEPLKNELIVR